MKWLVPLSLACLLCVPSLVPAADPWERTEDVVYGRKHGMALTLDVFRPKENSNGAAVVFMVSGGWYSSHDAINVGFFQEFLKRGYTVFAVVHGSQPRFTIPECVDDVRRSVRFIRANADKYKIDPNRIGVCGASAGGHLSLMLGTTGGDGNKKAADPVDRQSSRVQAVACFFPPTDFLNYGEENQVALGNGVLKDFPAPFEFNRFDNGAKKFVVISNEDERQKIGKEISPVYQASEDDAPTLIIHGDADKLVPIQQAELMVKALEEKKVPAKLEVRKGAVHGWATIGEDIKLLADWFDEHLKAKDAK